MQEEFLCAHCSWRERSDSGQSLGQSWTMKLSVALFFAGLFGALAAVFILLSFGTDYWLLASESCSQNFGDSLGSASVTVGVSVALKASVD